MSARGMPLWLGSLRTLARTYGVRGVMRRGIHEIRRSLGIFRRMPQAVSYARTGTRRVAYRPVGDWRTLPDERRERIIERGRRIMAGEYEAYGYLWRAWPGTPDEWHRHPAGGFDFPRHEWWKVPLLPPGADVKDVWEPARFTWVYDLVRAHWLTGSPELARTFHQRLAQWMAANPPFQGVHWACGQETAIRALAILHAEESLPSPDPAAALRLVSLLGWSGERIADAIGYGLSQRNNHGISEAAGLIHLGIRLRGLHPQAAHWLDRGVRLLEEQAVDQFSVDGWYSQHSFNYMRVAIEQVLYAQWALQAIGLTLSAGTLARVDAATALMCGLIDEHSGELPNHGANDGGRVAPLSSSPLRDFRPILTFAAVVRGSALPRDVRPDPEVVCWRGKELPGQLPARADGVFCGASGWAAARVGGCSVFLRAGRYRHRPSHLDALNIDVRIHGTEVIADAGTFAYNAPPPWKNGLVGAQVHNGPIVDGLEAARRGPRFLWLSWPQARLVSAEFIAGSAFLVAEQPESVRREVRITEDGVHVLDRVLDPAASSIRVTWLLHPGADPAWVVCSADVQRLEAREGDVTGWFSPSYGVRVRSRALRTEMARRGACIETMIRVESAATFTAR